jgi:hypothetical protein
MVVGLVKWAMPTGRAGAGGSAPCSITGASITFKVLATSSESFHLYPANRNWVDRQANWANADTTTPWQTPGALGTTDRGPALQDFTPDSTGALTISLSAVGTALVQSWLSDPASNYGIVLGHETHTDGFSIASFDYATPSSRPTLTYQCN